MKYLVNLNCEWRQRRLRMVTGHSGRCPRKVTSMKSTTYSGIVHLLDRPRDPHKHRGWTPFYFMYDPECSTTFPWCTINAPVVFAWPTNSYTKWSFVHRVERNSPTAGCQANIGATEVGHCDKDGWLSITKIYPKKKSQIVIEFPWRINSRAPGARYYERFYSYLN